MLFENEKAKDKKSKRIIDEFETGILSIIMLENM